MNRRSCLNWKSSECGQQKSLGGSIFIPFQLESHTRRIEMLASCLLVPQLYHKNRVNTFMLQHPFYWIRNVRFENAKCSHLIFSISTCIIHHPRSNTSLYSVFSDSWLLPAITTLGVSAFQQRSTHTIEELWSKTCQTVWFSTSMINETLQANPTSWVSKQKQISVSEPHWKVTFCVNF